jgi:hypothetical protein
MHCKMLSNVEIDLPMQKYNVLTLLASDSVVSHLELVGNTYSAYFLHCCWVSTAAFLGNQGLAWVAAPHTLFLG